MNKTTLLRVPACALVVAIVLGAGAPVARGDTLLTGIDLFSTPGPDVPGNNMYSPPLVTQINAGTTLTFNGALGTVTLPAAVPIDGNPSVFYSAYPGLASTPHPVDTFIGRDVPSGSLTTPGTTIPISVQALSLQSIGTVGGYKLYVLGADTTATNVPNLTPAVNAVTGFVSALFAATHQTPPSPLVPPTALGGKITINPLNPTLNPPIGNNFNSVLPLNVYVVATNGTDTEYATFTENSIGDPGLAGTAVPFSLSGGGPGDQHGLLGLPSGGFWASVGGDPTNVPTTEASVLVKHGITTAGDPNITPVPEPATVLLFSVGLGVLALGRRRLAKWMT